MGKSKGGIEGFERVEPTFQAAYERFLDSFLAITNGQSLVNPHGLLADS